MICFRNTSLVAPMAGFVAACVLVITSFVVAKEEFTFAEAKAHYTYQVIKNIAWPNENRFDEFVVGLIGVDLDVKAAFESKLPKLIKGKAVSLEYQSDISFALDRYSVIYIGEESRQLNIQLFSRVGNVLIITDGKVDVDNQMISLISSRSKVEITLNRNNLSERGFLVSTGLLRLAGTKDDLTNQLRENDMRLDVLLKKVQGKEAALAELNEQFNQNSILLDSAKNELRKSKELLADNRSRLEPLLDEIVDSRSTVEMIRSRIKEQKDLVEQKKSDILMKEAEVDTLQSNIEENQKILNQQSKKIDRQSSRMKVQSSELDQKKLEINRQVDTIKEKDETIVAQQELMVAVILLSLVFFVAIYFLLKVNKLKNISNRKLEQLNSQLYELATTDGLTQLFNRRHFLETSQKELLRQQRNNFKSTLLMVDIDFFKKVNDTYGHAMGDEAISAVAAILLKNLRDYDLVGRLGGEEFGMMLTDCDIDSATVIARRVCDDVAVNDIIYGDVSISVTISIGLSQLNNDDTDVTQALNRADIALYNAKESGRNCVVVFSEQMAT